MPTATIKLFLVHGAQQLIMVPKRPHRTFALLGSAALLASVAVVTVATPATAQPTCDGLVATITDNDGNDADPRVGFIVGTEGPDVIVGTDGADVIDGLGGQDVICGGRGDDVLNGGDGKDDLFGNGGDDIMLGEGGGDFMKGGRGDDSMRAGGGADTLKGNDGNDYLRGQGGDDTLDGGSRFDDCKQGAGSGPVRNCETADLKIKVIGPVEAPQGTVTFKVRVKNRGPGASSYSYSLDEENMQATCDGPQPWEGEHSFGELAPGARRTHKYDVTCSWNQEGAWVEVRAVLKTDAQDPRAKNNSDTSRTNLLE